jgi:hypothetical protein
MHWYHYVAHFFGGAFLANAVPHLMAGITGRQCQTPFAKPPFRGLSSPEVNVLYGMINLALAYFLLFRVGAIDLRNWADVLPAFAGFGAMAFLCAGSFRRLRAQGQS